MSERVRIDSDVQDLLPGFARNRFREWSEVGAALAAGDYRECRRIAHRLKGTGLSYGFDGLTALAMALEEAAESGAREQVESLHEEWRAYLETVEVLIGGQSRTLLQLADGV